MLEEDEDEDAVIERRRRERQEMLAKLAASRSQNQTPQPDADAPQAQAQAGMAAVCFHCSREKNVRGLGNFVAKMPYQTPQLIMVPNNYIVLLLI
jgi:hypothetical protein